MGWALKSKPKTARFSEKQKSFLESEFLEGGRSSKKTTGEEVANNQRLFSIDEFLTPSKISSYFSFYQALENDDMLLEGRNDLMKSLNDESRRHPLRHGDLQLCQMTQEELSSLRMTRLKSHQRFRCADLRTKKGTIRKRCCFYCRELQLQSRQCTLKCTLKSKLAS